LNFRAKIKKKVLYKHINSAVLQAADVWGWVEGEMKKVGLF